MIEIILSVCLIAQADECKDVHLRYLGDSVTPMQCLMGGQPQIARWIEGHPKWTVKRWKCGRVRTTQRAI